MAKPDIAQPEERTRQTEALRLRLAGLAYDQIAERLGYSDRSGAFRAVQAVLDRQESHAAEELRKIEDARLDLLWLKAFPGVMAGDVKSIEVAARLHDRRARLHGLSAPQRVQVQAEGVTQLELTTRVQADMRELGLDRAFAAPPQPDDPAEPWANT
ncbi:hypothetical protein [Nocardia testacea]|uniref:hypothetical protein n=1 Tax=Nocardia testacea TaxID=248551 RepID=UPI0002F30CF6|nr:hypothetical protein [Nocardia testacea]